VQFTRLGETGLLVRTHSQLQCPLYYQNETLTGALSTRSPLINRKPFFCQKFFTEDLSGPITENKKPPVAMQQGAFE